MKTYHFNVDVLWMMHTTCGVQADSEEEAYAKVMADDPDIEWEGSLEWGSQEKILAAELDEDDEDE